MGRNRTATGDAFDKTAARGSNATTNAEPAEYVYEEISQAILDQRLRPGTKLGELMVSEIFGVARPVVRRALMRLSYENLVDIRPYRGAFVASPSPEEARQVFEARRVIENWIVRACIDHINRTFLSCLRSHVEVETDAAGRGERVKWIRLSGEFHLELARVAGNQRLHGFLQDLVAQTSLIISLYGNSTENICCTDEHEHIVEAIAGGDPAEAARSMREHLCACESGLRFARDHEPEDLRAIFAPVDRENARRRPKHAGGGRKRAAAGALSATTASKSQSSD